MDVLKCRISNGICRLVVVVSDRGFERESF